LASGEKKSIMVSVDIKVMDFSESTPNLLTSKKIKL